MNYIKSIFDVIASYVTPGIINLSANIKVIKAGKFNHDLPIWQIVENENYPKTREKLLGRTSFKTGLQYTIDFIRNESANFSFNKVLVLTAENVENINFDVDYDCFDVVIGVRNIGLDLGAHKHTMAYFCKEYSKNSTGILVLSNSSFRPEPYCFSMNFLSLSSQPKTLLGVSYGYGPRYYLFKKYHLQSFFLASNVNFMYEIFSEINVNTNNKYYVIRNGELKITSSVYQKGGISICYDNSNFFIADHLKMQLKFYDHRLN
jgi:hypothetical protein